MAGVTIDAVNINNAVQTTIQIFLNIIFSLFFIGFQLLYLNIHLIFNKIMHPSQY